MPFPHVCDLPGSNLPNVLKLFGQAFPSSYEGKWVFKTIMAPPKNLCTEKLEEHVLTRVFAGL